MFLEMTNKTSPRHDGHSWSSLDCMSMRMRTPQSSKEEEALTKGATDADMKTAGPDEPTESPQQQQSQQNEKQQSQQQLQDPPRQQPQEQEAPQRRGERRLPSRGVALSLQAPRSALRSGDNTTPRHKQRSMSPVQRQSPTAPLAPSTTTFPLSDIHRSPAAPSGSSSPLRSPLAGSASATTLGARDKTSPKGTSLARSPGRPVTTSVTYSTVPRMTVSPRGVARCTTPSHGRSTPTMTPIPVTLTPLAVTDVIHVPNGTLPARVHSPLASTPPQPPAELRQPSRDNAVTGVCTPTRPIVGISSPPAGGSVTVTAISPTPTLGASGSWSPVHPVPPLALSRN